MGSDRFRGMGNVLVGWCVVGWGRVGGEWAGHQPRNQNPEP